MRDLAAFELAARRGKYAQIVTAQAADEARMAEIAEVDAHRVERTTEALDYLDALRETGDGDVFASAMEQWCRKPGVDPCSWTRVGVSQAAREAA